MTIRTTNHSLLVKALRILLCVGALTAGPAWGTVVTWQLSPGGTVEATSASRQDHRNVAWESDHAAGSNVSNQLSFRNGPESSATSQMSELKSAALNDKLQARDTDFEQAPPSTLSSSQVQSATLRVGAFDQQFGPMAGLRSAPTVLVLASAPVGGTASVGGDPVPVPEMSALFPIVGLVVAVSCTRILRRRRAAQLSTTRNLV